MTTIEVTTGVPAPNAENAPSSYTTPPVSPPPTPASFSQSDIDRIVGQRIAEAKAGIEKSLGMTPEAAAAALAAAESARRAGLDEVERGRLEATEMKSAAEAKASEAAAYMLRAKVTMALVSASVPASETELVARLVDVGPDASDKDITAAVTALKARMPVLFGPTPAPVAGGIPATGAPATPTGGTGSTVDPYQAGVDRAKAMERTKYDFEIAR